MNTSDLIDRLAAANANLTKAQAKEVVDALLGAMRDRLAQVKK